jgi:hypothetical protein
MAHVSAVDRHVEGFKKVITRLFGYDVLPFYALFDVDGLYQRMGYVIDRQRMLVKR